MFVVHNSGKNNSLRMPLLSLFLVKACDRSGGLIRKAPGEKHVGFHHAIPFLLSSVENSTSGAFRLPAVKAAIAAPATAREAVLLLAA